MADLSSILGGMVQGFKDFGTGLVDMFGTGGAAIGDAIESIRTGRATNKNQDDFRKWLYQTDNTQDAAAKGLGTILNGVQTVSDFIPGAGAVTRNPLFNGVQGAIGGVADEFKMAGKDYDLGRAAQRAGVGAASGLASAYTNQALGKTGNKLINNGLVRGAAGGALAGGIANAGYTGIEGGSVQDMINAGLYGAQTGALVGGTTGLARELIKPNHKMDVALTDEEKAARIANIDDQIGKLDLNTPEGSARYNELMNARNKYTNTFYHGYSATPTETGDTLGEGMYMTTDKNRAGGYAKGGGLESYDTSNLKLADLDDIVPENVAEVLKSNPQLSNRLKALTPVTETFTDRDAAYSRWNALKNEFPVDQMVSRKTATGYEITYPGEADYSKITGKDIFRKLTTPEAQGVYMDAGYDGVSKTALGGDTEVAVYRNKERLVPRTVADLMTESKPKTYYHGSPELDITEFDMGRAGKNTRSGEKAIYFTDTPEAAEEFAYERIPTDSNFIDKAGKRGGVYEANLDIRNTLDLDNLTDAQIKELWPYASYMGSWQGEDVFARDIKHWRDVKNPQLIKGYLDLEKLANSPYDSLSATMYPNTGNKAKEYAIFDASKAKITKSPKTVADLMLSPEQEAFFKNSKLRDENGKLIKMYHGTPDGSFTEFNEGSYFTPNKEYADGYQWEGASVLRSNKKAVNPKTYEVYINTEKPFTLSDPKARDIYLNEYIKGGNSMYYDPYTDWTKAVNDLSEVDWTEGEDLRAWLKENHPEYDALYLDEGGDGGYGEAEYKWRGNSVVPFNANQIKSVDNLKPTADADIMYSKVADGQLGLFDQPMPKPEPEPVTLPKSLGEQASLFDQPKQPIVEAQVVDTEPVNPYAPVDGQVTQAMRDRAAEVLKNYAKKGVPDNELYNMIDESTLPAGYKEFREIVDSGKSYAKEKLGAENANKADLRRVVEYLYDDTAKQEEMLRNVKIEESNDAARRAMYGLAPRKSGSSFSEKMLRRAADEKLTKEFTEKISKIENRVPELMNSLRRYNPSDLSVRKGLTAAADELYSERLGIAPGNTIKYNGPADVRNAYGRYSKQSKNLALTRSNVSDPEQAISTVAHERLHSFQNEADLNRGKYGVTNRYDKRVTDAFDELRKDLEEAKVYKSYPETAERYGSKDAEYFHNTKEQEARMLQQYLNNKGYADLAELKSVYTDKGRSGEFGNEVNAPFDKFFEKLRALSKKGVALPALTALFGGGAIAGALTSGKDDKKKKSEVK